MRFQAPADDLPGWAQRLPFYYGWVIAGVSWLVIFTSAPGQTYVVSIFVEPVIHDMGMTVNMVIWPNYFGRSALGSIRGVASTAMVAAAALGPLPFGYAVTLSGGYNVALLTFVTLPMLCMVTSLLAVAPPLPNRKQPVKHNHVAPEG